MAVPEKQADSPPPPARPRLWPRRWRARIGLGSAAAALAAGSAVWVSRDQIAADSIDQYFADAGVPATFDIIAIGPRLQVIENLVIGDPARPDLTVRRMVVELGLGWAGPQVERVTLDGLRAYGRYREGKVSFGALDPLIYTEDAATPALPAIDLVLRDARLRLDSDFGPVGLWAQGSGRLDDGFSGTLAATGPGIGVAGCRAGRASLYGTLSTRGGAARLDGPIRLGDLDCGGVRLARADIGSVLALKPDFSGATGDFRIEGRTLAAASARAEALTGTATLTWGGANVALGHDLTLTDLAAPQGRLARLDAEGTWRGASDGTRGQWEGTLRGAGLAPAPALTADLAAAERGLEGTLMAPVLAQARGGLERGLSGAGLSLDALLRHNDSGIAVNISDAVLSARDGTPLMAASQVSAGLGAAGLTGLRGNILAGGAGLPALNARIGPRSDGGWRLRLTMADYAAGADRVAIPRLTVEQGRGGAIRFDGLVTADGALPGGAVRALAVPLEGQWSPQRGFALGTACTPLAFDSLKLSGLALSGQRINLCPAVPGQPILTYASAPRFAAQIGPLALAGTLGESPAQFRAESALLRYPAPFVIEGLGAAIGTGDSAVRLNAARLTGSLGGTNEALAGGEFSGGTAQLAAVPLDLSALSGRWRFAQGGLRVEEGALMLADRPAEGEARFHPLSARGATLAFDGEVITADATLRHPGSDREVARVNIRHQLETARGSADLSVPGLVFGPGLQPEDLSTLAEGVIALAEGRVTGTGRIDWTADDITSHGSVASDGLDFAAAFGPVRGLKGSVAFTDLLNLTTAPDQRVSIAAINPGIEVLAGEVQFDLSDATLLRLDDARFPFMGGKLRMRPLVMDFSKPEERRYIFEIVGLDAATFVTQMELTNLGATGTFDGTVPIVFDKDGNGRIEGGVLLARAPGGNVAYIGELTYEDLGTMANYAFAALRSLDYTQMAVGLNGNLAGEIITSFEFDGVRQGAGTSQNFVTRRLSRLPIRFKVNVRSENFYELATMVRSFWDVDYLGNPVDRGLLRAKDGRFVPATSATGSLPLADQPVQPSESDDQP